MIARRDFAVRDKLQQQWQEMVKKSFTPTEWYLKEDDRDERPRLQRPQLPSRVQGEGLGTGTH